ncbi:repetitive proline-rich cell wall protein 3-like [Abrus precatorius]|uniref:Repetitive proline-rich cell wall protein 3-like n=1 Tax=Abrus precatorius TaxID=3816 RepID=A0A8B8KGN9_ABRPR|nr:repetitive proline-rich cell wall protein 3-like [Abrus precatorius]
MHQKTKITKMGSLSFLVLFIAALILIPKGLADYYKPPEKPYKPPVYKPPVYKPPVYKPPVYKPPVEKPPVYKPPVYKPPYKKPPYKKPPYGKYPPTEDNTLP